jgi:hypothetical protein
MSPKVIRKTGKEEESEEEGGKTNKLLEILEEGKNERVV